LLSSIDTLKVKSHQHNPITTQWNLTIQATLNTDWKWKILFTVEYTFQEINGVGSEQENFGLCWGQMDRLKPHTHTQIQDLFQLDEADPTFQLLIQQEIAVVISLLYFHQQYRHY
jgi:hypothetical protein